MSTDSVLDFLVRHEAELVGALGKRVNALDAALTLGSEQVQRFCERLVGAFMDLHNTAGSESALGPLRVLCRAAAMRGALEEVCALPLSLDQAIGELVGNEVTGWSRDAASLDQLDRWLDEIETTGRTFACRLMDQAREEDLRRRRLHEREAREVRDL